MKMNEFSEIDNSISLPLDRLSFQYIPQTLKKELWANNNNRMLSIANSPHYDLISQYQNGVKLKQLMKSKYANMFRYWNSICYGERSEGYIRNKIESFIITYENIKSKGYIASKKKVIVLDQPISVSRYKIENIDVSGMEIWHGHHRATCCYFLGIEKIECFLMKDSFPGTKKFYKFDKAFESLKIDRNWK